MEKQVVCIHRKKIPEECGHSAEVCQNDTCGMLEERFEECRSDKHDHGKNQHNAEWTRTKV